MKICEVLCIRKSLVYKTLHLYATLSDVASPNSRTAGRRRSLNYEDINYIKSHCHLHSSAFLDELQSDLLSQRGVKVSVSTLLNSATSWYHTQGSISSRPWAEWWKTRRIHEQHCWHCSQSWDANVWRRGCKEWSYISSTNGILATRNAMCSVSMLHSRNTVVNSTNPDFRWDTHGFVTG